MPDMFIFGLYNGWLVGVSVDTIDDIAAESAWMLENGFKQPRFQEAFTPVDAVVVKREMHDKKTKTGRDMWRFYCNEGDGSGKEHMVIAFDEEAFKRGDKVIITMGSYGKEAKRAGASGWTDDGAGHGEKYPQAGDIPF